MGGGSNETAGTGDDSTETTDEEDAKCEYGEDEDGSCKCAEGETKNENGECEPQGCRVDDINVNNQGYMGATRPERIEQSDFIRDTQGPSCACHYWVFTTNDDYWPEYCPTGDEDGEEEGVTEEEPVQVTTLEELNDLVEQAAEEVWAENLITPEQSIDPNYDPFAVGGPANHNTTEEDGGLVGPYNEDMGLRPMAEFPLPENFGARNEDGQVSEITTDDSLDLSRFDKNGNPVTVLRIPEDEPPLSLLDGQTDLGTYDNAFFFENALDKPTPYTFPEGMLNEDGTLRDGPLNLPPHQGEIYTDPITGQRTLFEQMSEESQIQTMQGYFDTNINSIKNEVEKRKAGLEAAMQFAALSGPGPNGTQFIPQGADDEFSLAYLTYQTADGIQYGKYAILDTGIGQGHVRTNQDVLKGLEDHVISTNDILVNVEKIHPHPADLNTDSGRPSMGDFVAQNNTLGLLDDLVPVQHVVVGNNGVFFYESPADLTPQGVIDRETLLNIGRYGDPNEIRALETELVAKGYSQADIDHYIDLYKEYGYSSPQYNTVSYQVPGIADVTFFPNEVGGITEGIGNPWFNENPFIATAEQDLLNSLYEKRRNALAQYGFASPAYKYANLQYEYLETMLGVTQ